MAEDGAEEDAALAAAAVAGDQAAFSMLMQRHKHALYRFVVRYVGDADEAYDLVQEAFVSAWTARASFDRTRSFAIWLRRIALNKCRDWSRRRRVRRFFFAAAPLEAADAISADDQANDDMQDASVQLDRAIETLPQRLKEPLLLVVFEALSHRQASRILGISEKAVETRIYRAKQRLREVLRR